MRYLYFSILTVFFISCQSTGDNSKDNPAVTLSFHPEKGTKKEMGYEFKIESPSNKSELHFFVDFNFETVQSSDAGVDVKISYENIRLKGNIDTMSFDLQAGVSDSTSQAMIYAEPYFLCLNHEFLLKYSEKMEKTSEELLTLKDEKSLIAPANKIQFFTALPGSSIKPGDKWESSVELKSGKGMTVKAIYELLKVEKGVAYIEFKGDLDGSGEGFGHDFSMKGKVTGNLEVELSSGLTLSSEMVQDLILVLSEKETPMKFTIKQYIK